jgi:hypothetical protein
MDDSAMLMWGILFGSLGSGYMVYGKKQHHLWAFVSGLGLCVIPYLSTSLAVLIPGAAALLAFPFLMR